MMTFIAAKIIGFVAIVVIGGLVVWILISKFGD